MAERPFLPRLLAAFRPHAPWVLAGLVLGGVLGLLAYFSTATEYEARGTFLIDQLPFGVQDQVGSDPETARQLVQSLILSVSSEGMRREVAAALGVPGKSLAFTDHDRAVSLSGGDRRRANIEISATRNSRLGTVTADSADRAFAVSVVAAVLDRMQMLNQIAGRLEQIDFRLKLNSSEASNLVQELATVAADRIKYETQVAALDSYIAKKAPLDDFPAFATDATLSNLETQLILVDSDYASVAAQATAGARLAGKRGELDNLRAQIDQHTAGLARGLRASLQIAQTREASLRDHLNQLEQSSAQLESLQTALSRGFGDFSIRDDLAKVNDPQLAGEASVVVVVDPAYSPDRPVKPVLAVDLALGLLLGMALGFAFSSVRLQFRRA
jgi:uncharacterized protein involved in exopolysaccharide biosynthesis